MKNIPKIILFVFLLTVIIGKSQNNNLSNRNLFDGEPYIKVNPTNSQHIVIAWMGFDVGKKTRIKTRVTFDAGLTWSSTVTIPHVANNYTSADPSIAFDNNGNVFLSFLDYLDNPLGGGVQLTKSIDGGLTWGGATEVININADGGHYPIDRPWMVIDNSGGINDGYIYISTMSPGNLGTISPPHHPYLSRSTNGGVSFLPYKYIDNTGWLSGNVIPQPMPTPAVSGDGTLHVIYPSYVTTQSVFAQYILASSTDGGNTLNYNSVFLSPNAAPNNNAKKGYLLKTNPSDVNHLAFFYLDVTNNEMDVFMRESFDKGVNWSVAIKINDDATANNRLQDLVWADFDTDGDLVVTWRDRRNALDSVYETSSEIWATVRWKDSINFSPNFPLTDSSISYNTILSQNGNDFMSSQLINDTLYAVWGDTRNGFLNIWFQQVDLATGVTVVKDLANAISSINIYPNPSKNKLTINLQDNEYKEAHFEVLNALGEFIYDQKVTGRIIEVNISDYPTGTYFIKFTNKKGSKVIKFVKSE